MFPGDEKVLRDVCVRQREKLRHADSRGWSPLHEAAVQTNHNVLELVFTGGGSERRGCAPAPSNSEELCCPASGPESVQGRTRLGQTPLFLAAERGLMENVSFLLQHGADPDSLDQVQDSPLIAGMRTNTSSEAREAV